MAGSDIPDTAGRKTRRRRRQTPAKCYAFHANTKHLVVNVSVNFYK